MAGTKKFSRDKKDHENSPTLFRKGSKKEIKTGENEEKLLADKTRPIFREQKRERKEWLRP